MATTKSSKTTKRKAHDSDRAYAAALVQCFWQGLPYRMKFDGETWHMRVDGEELARQLQSFAESGNFGNEALPVAERVDAARELVQFLADANVLAKNAIPLAANALGVSVDTIENDLYGRKKHAKQKP